MHLVLCLEGLPLLPLDLGPARGVGVPLGIHLGHAGELPPLLLLREWESGELPARCRRPIPAPPISLSLPNSHRTFHDVGIRERHRSLAPVCYPPVVPDLRIEDQRRIRGLGHVRVARVDVAVFLALAPLPVRGQEGESVDVGHCPRRSLLVPAGAVSGRGLRNATARGVTALGLDVTDLDLRIDIGHAVAAFGVTGRCLLTAIGHAVSVRVPLPAGESGMNARVHPPSRIARVTARSLASNYLALLPACGRRRQDGWPDEKPRRVLGRLPRSLLVVSEAAAAATPVAGGAAITALPSVVQDLAKFFLSLSGSSSQWVIGGMAGVTASAVVSGGAACPSTAAGGAVTTCTTAVMPVGAGVSPAALAAVPGVSGEQQRQVESRSRGRRSRSFSDGTDRRAKKRARRRPPSPGRSSRRRGRHHRSSSDSSEEDRAEVSPPRSGRAHGGAPGGASSSREYD